MQYTLSINQTKALEWGLNAQQSMLFSFIYECPSWCRPVTQDGEVFYAISKQKIVDELPLLTDKPDTAYRLLKQLEAKGVVALSHTPGITLVRITDTGKTWNHDHKGSEKYPSKVGKKSDAPRKNIRAGSEKSPTNQDTSNQDTNNQSIDASAAADAPHGSRAERRLVQQKTTARPDVLFEQVWSRYPKRAGSNPKNKAQSAWNARKKLGVSPAVMANGLDRYIAFCEATGRVGTEFVMQAARFFGPSHEFENDWTPAVEQPKPQGKPLQASGGPNLPDFNFED